MHISSIKKVEEWLEQIPKFQSVGSSASKFDLSRFEQFCAYLGDPQHEFPSIHVAGTNGKGSTCHILDSVLGHSGYKVGVYTSPHILHYRERFKINGNAISDDQLVSFFQHHAPKMREHKLTYFEISTAVAFWWFAQSNVDIAVIEVGLGGRLDATNVIDPLVSVITSISVDHTDLLGESTEEIAREKGGIIKKGRPVVIGDLPEKARDEIVRLAEQNKTNISTIDQLNTEYIGPGHYQLEMEDVITIKTNLVSPVQLKNIAVAWRVVQLLGDTFSVTPKQFVAALRHVNVGAGRFEKLLESRQWYFDGGHNLEAIRALKQSIQTVGQIDEAVLVLSMMKDKLRPEVMSEFLDFKNIYYYPLRLERAATFDDIKLWLPQVNPFPDDQTHQSFLNDVDTELVIFAGSFYFYQTVRDWISHLL